MDKAKHDGLKQALAKKENLSARGQADGYAALDGDGHVPDGQSAITLQRTTQKGQANGYASLNGSGDVPDGQISGNIARLANPFDPNRYHVLENEKFILFSRYGGVPVGCVIFVAHSMVPAGYLHANGAQVSRITYNRLFYEIGTRFGQTHAVVHAG